MLICKPVSTKSNRVHFRFEMKKWSIAKRKMAWQVTGDRNIGGHTARIPDSFSFLSGPGPRGVGIDLSTKGRAVFGMAIALQEFYSKNAINCFQQRSHHHHLTACIIRS